MDISISCQHPSFEGDIVEMWPPQQNFPHTPYVLFPELSCDHTNSSVFSILFSVFSPHLIAAFLSPFSSPQLWFHPLTCRALLVFLRVYLLDAIFKIILTAFWSQSSNLLYQFSSHLQRPSSGRDFRLHWSTGENLSSKTPGKENKYIFCGEMRYGCLNPAFISVSTWSANVLRSIYGLSTIEDILILS